jgi:AcrR family transcriptional regulator
VHSTKVEGVYAVKRRSRNSLNATKIIDASLKIVNERGIESLSMREIAKELSCSVASPYAYFSSREDIIKELIRRGEKILTHTLIAAKKKHTDVLLQLREIAYTYWNFAIANRELHKLMFDTLSTKGYRKVFTYIPSSYRVFLETLRSGVESQAIQLPKKRYHAIAMTMWAWMYGLLVLEMTGLLKNRNKKTHPIEEGIVFFQDILLKPHT